MRNKLFSIILSIIIILSSCDNDTINEGVKIIEDTISQNIIKDTIVELILYKENFEDLNSWNFFPDTSCNKTDTCYAIITEAGLEIGFKKHKGILSDHEIIGIYGISDFFVEDSIVESLNNVGLRVGLSQGEFYRLYSENPRRVIDKYIYFTIKDAFGIDVKSLYDYYSKFNPEGNITNGNHFDFYIKEDSVRIKIDNREQYSGPLYKNGYINKMTSNANSSRVRLGVTVNDPFDRNHFEKMEFNYIEIYTKIKSSR